MCEPPRDVGPERGRVEREKTTFEEGKVGLEEVETETAGKTNGMPS